MPVKSEYYTTNSRKLFYRTGGDGPTALVMIHGLAGDSRLFHNQIKYFSSFYRTIAPDLPGHGKSDNFTDSTLQDWSDALHGIIEKEKIENSFIIGHSMGGAVAVDYYFKHRDSVKALILVSTTAKFNIAPGDIESAANDFTSFYELLIKKSFYRKPEILLSAAKNHMSREHQAGIIKGLQIFSNLDFTDKLKEINVPVLLAGNRFDSVVPAELTEDTGKKIKDSKTVILEKKGHVPFFEDSSIFNMEIEKFISQL